MFAKQISDNTYEIFRHEDSKNPIKIATNLLGSGCWRLIDNQGIMIDRDVFRHDLFERNEIEIIP